MKDSAAQRQAALDAVASHFGGRKEECRGGRGDHLLVAGKRIAVEFAVLGGQAADCAGLARPRLRFDRVAQEFIARMRADLSLTVPEGLTVFFTITAPIRMASRTAEALEMRIAVALARQGTEKVATTIEQNRIRVRIAKSGRGSPKVVGFVHNPIPGTDRILLDTAEELLRHAGAAANRPAPPASTNEKWLVLAAKTADVPIEALRQIYAQISPRTVFSKLLVVDRRGRVEPLTN